MVCWLQSGPQLTGTPFLCHVQSVGTNGCPFSHTWGCINERAGKSIGLPWIYSGVQWAALALSVVDDGVLMGGNEILGFMVECQGCCKRGLAGLQALLQGLNS